MKNQAQRLGQTAENLAANLLKSKGLKILQQNYKTKIGEIDILALDGRALVLVEVKAKTSGRFGSALEMITRSKQEKLILLAHELQSKTKHNNVRIDVVAVDQASSKPVLKHYKGLIEYNG